MSTYTGKTATIKASAASIADKFADMSRMGDNLDKMSEEQRQKIGNVRFTQDSMTMVNPSVGEVTFKVIEHSENAVRMLCNNPMKMELSLNFEAVSEDETNITPAIDIDIPAMIRPMIGPHLQKAADQMGNMISGMLVNE